MSLSLFALRVGVKIFPKLMAESIDRALENRYSLDMDMKNEQARVASLPMAAADGANQGMVEIGGFPPQAKTREPSLAPVQRPFNFDLPYGGHVPYAARETSVAAAVALTPKVGKWQARVLLALLNGPYMSDEQLELYLGCERTRTSRPRRRELELLGYVEDSGERVTGIGGTNVIRWRLTPAGVNKAVGLEGAQA